MDFKFWRNTAYAAAASIGAILMAPRAEAFDTALIARYAFNNQIDHGAYLGFAFLQRSGGSCDYMVERNCSKIKHGHFWGPFFDLQFGYAGVGHGFGFINDQFSVRYSRLRADTALGSSSDRFAIGVNLGLIHLEAGIKQNDRDKEAMPSLGIALGL